MIVRCTDCNSAFAVDDSKVEDKKFAYTCPKCSTENIVDNRISDQLDENNFPGGAEMDLTEDTSQDGTSAFSSVKEELSTEAGLEEDKFSDIDFLEGDGESEILESENENFKSDGELEPAEWRGETTADGETEYVLDESIIEEELSGPEKISPAEEEMMLKSAELIEEEFPEIPEEPEPAEWTAKVSADGETEYVLDEKVLEEEVSKEVVKEELGVENVRTEVLPLEDDFILDGTVHSDKSADIESPGTGQKSGYNEKEFDEALNESIIEKNRIQNLSAVSEKDTEDITLDLDELDIELEEETSEPEPEKGSAEEPAREEDITLDLDELDIDLEEEPPEPEPEKGSVEEPALEEDITLDLDELDIDLEEEPPEPEPEKASAEEPAQEEDITLDLDELDIDLEEEPVPAKGVKSDELDFDLPIISEEIPVDGARMREGEEEDITLDLESLDITLEKSDEIQKSENLEDEKITLEDTGLTFEELTVGDVHKKEETWDDLNNEEEITLEDAGLTFEELTSEEVSMVTGEGENNEEEELRITLDEIDPNLSVHDLEGEFNESEVIPLDLEDDMVEIELEEDYPESDFDDDVLTEKEIAVSSFADQEEEYDIFKETKGSDLTDRGAVDFSIDYSLRYSRLGAFLRLTGIFLIGLIPHFIVFIIYSILSVILGLLNHIVVLFTGNTVEDFSEILENSIRYFLSICTSSVGIVEEFPVFAGNKNIDHALQVDITYPPKYSRIWAGLRLSVAGIIIAALPHLLVLFILSLVVPVVFIIAMLSVLVSARWPRFLIEFLTVYYRYLARILFFVSGVVDEYPPFRFE